MVERACAAERAVTERTDYSEAVARGVAHLWAYKDEYEVARLLTRPELLAHVQAEMPGATKVKYNLHPPALRSMGMSSKLKLGAWSRPMLKATAEGRGCAAPRSTRSAGPRCAGWSASSRRRTPRSSSSSAPASHAASYDVAVAKAATAEIVRGYEDIKLGNVARYRQTLADLG